MSDSIKIGFMQINKNTVKKLSTKNFTKYFRTTKIIFLFLFHNLNWFNNIVL